MASPEPAAAELPEASPGARILDTAYALFSHHGVRAVGVDRVIEVAGVAKRTFYRHYPSKDELILAFLHERSRRWTRDWLEATIERLADAPAARTLALFDALDEWFNSSDYEGCSFIRTIHETWDGPLHQATIAQFELVRELLVEHARQAGVREPEPFAYQIQILMMGAMVSAMRGDASAARRARPLAALLLEQAREQ